MKTLRYLLFAIFVLAAISLFGQKTGASRAETENWLLQKLNKNISPSTKCFAPLEIIELTVCLTYTNIIFSFSGDNLIIDANTRRSEKGVDENYRTNWSIPIYALTNNNIYTTKLTFHCAYSAIAETSTNGYSPKISILHFDFNISNEENLSERLNKAFNHLRTFIKKPKSSEPF